MGKIGLPGVYAITNKVTGDQYVGSSIDVGGRFLMHKVVLRKGEGSTFLQAAWDTYGEDAFQCELLATAGSNAELERLEREWFERLAPAYNIKLPTRKGVYCDDTFAWHRRRGVTYTLPAFVVDRTSS